MRHAIYFSVLAVTLALSVCGTLQGAETHAAAPHAIDLDVLTKETQQFSKDPARLTLVWWIPQEFWMALFAENPTVSPAEFANLRQTLRPYVVVVVIDGTVGADGALNYRSEDALRADLRMHGNAGLTYAPLATKQLSAEVSKLLASMQPILADMLGLLGKNMHILLFPAGDAHGKPFVDPYHRGTLTMALDHTRQVTWHLPLGALVPDKTCPTCGETFSGTYDYCPYDGTKLQASKTITN
jgi:hypothetical protein